MGQAAPPEMQEDLQVKFSVLSKVQMPILEELDRLSRTCFIFIAIKTHISDSIIIIVRSNFPITRY